MTTLTGHTVELGTSDHLGVLATITPPAAPKPPHPPTEEKPMSVLTAAQFEEALRDWLGDRLHLMPNWQTRTSAGGFNPRGMLHHWTAMRTTGPNAVGVAAQNRLLADGRPGLDGPLCHLAPTRHGDLWVVAGPRANANHAGDGDADVYRKVLAGTFDGSPAPDVDSVDGNEVLYGLEYHYHPDDGPMPDEQIEVGILAASALAQAHGWSPAAAAGSQLDHYEWTRRKIDRDRDNLANRTRAGVRAALLNPQHPREEFRMDAEAKTAFEELDKDTNATYAAVVNTRAKVDWIANQLKVLVNPDALAAKIATQLADQLDDADTELDVETVKAGVRAVFAELATEEDPS